MKSDILAELQKHANNLSLLENPEIVKLLLSKQGLIHLKEASLLSKEMGYNKLGFALDNLIKKIA